MGTSYMRRDTKHSCVVASYALYWMSPDEAANTMTSMMTLANGMSSYFRKLQ